MEGCDFKIGDRVASIDDVKQWASGYQSDPMVGEVFQITEKSDGIFISTEIRMGKRSTSVVREGDIKTVALKHLASRMVAIAGS